jgi:hypothetical protein
MSHSRLAEAALIGCLTALASFCALSATAGETYAIVAQSNRATAATGRRPLSERIAAANLPIITQSAAAPPRGVLHQDAAQDTAQDTAQQDTGQATAQDTATGASTMENMAVAAVRVDHELQAAPEKPSRPAVTPPVLWPFGTRWTAAATPRTSPAKQPVAAGKSASSSRQASAGPKTPATGRAVQRQASARSSGNGLSNSSPASVTR